MSLIPVEGRDGLFRDSSSGAIINKNKSDYQKYIANRERMNSDKQRIESLENKVDTLSSDINDIKNMLLQALNK